MLKIMKNIASIATVITLIIIPFVSQAHAEKLKVVATFSIIGDLAHNVGGDKIELTTLVGPNSDAHVYEPRPADAIALAKADVVLINGLLFEGFLTRLIEASGTNAAITELTEGANILSDPAGGHYHFQGDKAIFHAEPNDPHAWQSIPNAAVYVNNIAKAFCESDAENCTTYEENAASYVEELNALDAEIKQSFAAISDEKRTIVVAHNAFRYFEHEYGVRFLSPQGVSTDSEASAADVAGLVREIKESRAMAVFAENITNSRLVEQIAQEANLTLGGTLYSDALSPSDGPAPTYIDMMRLNAATISNAIMQD